MSVTQDIQIFRERANVLLAKLGEELGYDVSVGKIRYGENEFKAEVKASKLITASGLSTAQENFNRWCRSFNLSPEVFGAVFVDVDVQYRVIGINPKAPKYPIEVERVYDKKKFKYTVTGVTAGMIK